MNVSIQGRDLPGRVGVLEWDRRGRRRGGRVGYHSPRVLCKIIPASLSSERPYPQINRSIIYWALKQKWGGELGTEKGKRSQVMAALGCWVWCKRKCVGGKAKHPNGKIINSWWFTAYDWLQIYFDLSTMFTFRESDLAEGRDAATKTLNPNIKRKRERVMQEKMWGCKTSEKASFKQWGRSLRSCCSWNYSLTRSFSSLFYTEELRTQAVHLICAAQSELTKLKQCFSEDGTTFDLFWKTPCLSKKMKPDQNK